jgi:hypothetical protein
VLVSTGVLWLGGGWDNPLRLALIVLGVGLLLGFVGWERRRRSAHPEALEVDRRPITVVLFVGVVIAIAQTVTMVQMPLYFSIVAGYGPLFGMVAVLPLFAALIVAGPIAGYLITRHLPRALVGRACWRSAPATSPRPRWSGRRRATSRSSCPWSSSAAGS